MEKNVVLWLPSLDIGCEIASKRQCRVINEVKKKSCLKPPPSCLHGKWCPWQNTMLEEHLDTTQWTESSFHSCLTCPLIICMKRDINSGHSRRKWKWLKMIFGFLKNRMQRDEWREKKDRRYFYLKVIRFTLKLVVLRVAEY